MARVKWALMTPGWGTLATSALYIVTRPSACTRPALTGGGWGRRQMFDQTYLLYLMDGAPVEGCGAFVHLEPSAPPVSICFLDFWIWVDFLGIS
jgi:hypothetical protein